MKLWKRDGVTYRKGDIVTLDVEWRNGRTVNMRGALITIEGDEAFIDSQFGPVVGSVDTLEFVERAADDADGGGS